MPGAHVNQKMVVMLSSIYHRHVTDLSWLAKSENGNEDDEAPLTSSTAASANFRMTEPTLPVINLVELPSALPSVILRE